GVHQSLLFFGQLLGRLALAFFGLAWGLLAGLTFCLGHRLAFLARHRSLCGHRLLAAGFGFTLHRLACLGLGGLRLAFLRLALLGGHWFFALVALRGFRLGHRLLALLALLGLRLGHRL